MLLSDYMAHVATEELAGIPEECKVALADREREVHEIAVTLMTAELAFTGDEAAKQILWEVAHLYAGAASRIGHIRGRIHRSRK